MADAQSIQTSIDGKNGAGDILPWRKVNLLRDAKVGDLETVTDGTSEGPNTSGSALDQVTTLAKILTRRYVAKTGERLDVFDLLVRVYQKQYEE